MPIEWDRVDATIGQENRERLNRKRVAVAGLGSLGADIPVLLASCGVGKFTLIDGDTLNFKNLTRHRAGQKHVGSYKVAAIREMVRDKNSNADIWAVAGNAATQPELLGNCDLLIIAGLGSERTQQRVAQAARARGVPVFVAGVYSHAQGGEIFLVRPDHHLPCYSCFSSFIGRTTSPDDPITHNFIYGVREDQIESMPGLSVDIGIISTITAKLALNFLLGREFHPDPRINLLIYSTSYLKLGGLSNNKSQHMNPLDAQWIGLPKDPNCPVCSSEHRKHRTPLKDIFKS